MQCSLRSVLCDRLLSLSYLALEIHFPSAPPNLEQAFSMFGPAFVVSSPIVPQNFWRAHLQVKRAYGKDPLLGGPIFISGFRFWTSCKTSPGFRSFLPYLLPYVCPLFCPVCGPVVFFPWPPCRLQPNGRRHLHAGGRRESRRETRRGRRRRRDADRKSELKALSAR